MRELQMDPESITIARRVLLRVYNRFQAEAQTATDAEYANEMRTYADKIKQKLINLQEREYMLDRPISRSYAEMFADRNHWSLRSDSERFMYQS